MGNMIRTLLAGLGLLLGLITPAWPAAAVDVTFDNPAGFTDVGNRRQPAERVRDAYLADLRQHLIKEAAKVLPPSQALQVVVTDVDMAGMFFMRDDVRIVRDVTPPRIALRFALRGADGTTIREGERRLTDPMFLWAVSLHDSDPLRHERRLLDQWVRQEFRQAD